MFVTCCIKRRNNRGDTRLSFCLLKEAERRSWQHNSFSDLYIFTENLHCACQYQLVVRGDGMKRKDEIGVGDFEDAFSSVPHASGLRLLLAIATQRNMHTDHVDISQAFAQGELLDGDGQNGKVYISAPPGYNEDSE